MSDKAKKFIEDILAVYKKHGLSISHEDGHGSFEIEEYDQYNENWLRAAKDSTR